MERCTRLQVPTDARGTVSPGVGGELFLMWVLGGELRSSGRAGHALNHLAIPPAYTVNLSRIRIDTRAAYTHSPLPPTECRGKLLLGLEFKKENTPGPTYSSNPRGKF